ncbi:hypothetical protein EDF70_101614 [Neorhizobium sp. JUb45]|nr:hypothetical protein EDF70_101614 [Neorhizobium sp. JUb45]
MRLSDFSLPPSALPGISPTRGEIWGGKTFPAQISYRPLKG